jgi:hypothetical protein
VPVRKPAAIRLREVKRIPWRCSAGYSCDINAQVSACVQNKNLRTKKSHKGIHRISARGSIFDRRSFGIPFVVSVAACEVRLLLS